VRPPLRVTAPIASIWGLLRLRHVLFAVGASVLVVLACSTPDVKFVPDEVAGHCSNEVTDPDLGESDRDCGGADCHRCALGLHCKETRDCSEGECIDGFCQEPGCDNHARDGEETAIDCGGGCKGCRDGQPCVSATDCESKVCGEDDRCASPTCTDGVLNGDENDRDCGGSFCDGCPVDSPCTEAAGCESGLCDPTTLTCGLNCKSGSDECDGVRQEPCETNLLNSARNCGACGNICELSHAEVSCVGGACQIEDCQEPWIRCNTDEADGCETNASVDAKNCGACGIECPALNGTASCVSSSCAIECDPGFGDCDKDANNGCEVSVVDVDNCGACGKRCPFDPGETPNCVGGKCDVAICEEGRGDCDGDDVCEATLGDDVTNCGRCGRVCSVAHGSARCVDGECVVDSCASGFKNCDESEPGGGFGNGCETNIATDPLNCGACGEDCEVENGMGTCEAGTCAIVSCDTGFKNCDADGSDDGLANGCETDTRRDAQHCGGCGNECQFANASSACVDSNCVLAQCEQLYADCTAADGCETDTSSSIQHCGSCTGTCSNAGATAISCSNGMCDPPTCDLTHGNCDDNDANGCETDITTVADCGGCGNACDSAAPNCVATNDVYRCQARITLASTSPYPVAVAIGNSLSFSYTPHAGTNRLILVAVTAESQNNGIAGARPDWVRFGTATMTAGPEQAGVSEWWSPDLFVYYVGESVISSRTSAQTITINGATAPAQQAIIAQLVELHGVRQDMPIRTSRGGFLGAPDPDDPATIGSPLEVATNGSAIYSFVSAYWMGDASCPAGTPGPGCPNWSISPSMNLTVTETVSTGPINLASDAPARVFGMLVTAPSANLPAAGTYTPRWSFPNSGRLTHLALVLAPARAP
jgi:hypothetical protein